MPVFSAAAVIVGLALEVCLAAALVRNRLWRVYPYFSVFVGVFVAKTLLLILFPPFSYPRFYWLLDLIDVLMRFLIIYEIGRYLFTDAALANIFSQGITLIISLLTIILIAMFWSYQAFLRSHSVWIAIERGSNFTQAITMLVMLVASRNYRIHIGRQLKVVATSFGAWASVSTLNNALFDFEYSLLPYWQVVRPLVFILLVSAWNWTLWFGAPEQKMLDSSSAIDMHLWNQEWERARLSLRRIKQL